MKLFNILKEICYRLNLIADYVVERGTVSYWTYEKWNSGKVVAKLYSSLQGVAINQSYGSALYVSRGYEYSIPSGLLKTMTDAGVTGNLGGTWGVVAWAETSAIRVCLVSPSINSNISAGYFWSVTVEGTWK